MARDIPSFADSATLYVSLGYKVFPLAEGAKLPIAGTHGFKDATYDASTIELWSRKYQRANIAVATGAASGNVIIDVDPRNGGLESLRRIEAAGSAFRCPVSKTGNGGRHYWFALGPSEHLKSNAGQLGPGIDVKADGGYIVAPPSIIGPSTAGAGGAYRWLVHPFDVRPPPLPDWLRRMLAPPRVSAPAPIVNISSGSGFRRLDGLARKVARARVGERNRLLNWAAYRGGELVRDGVLSEAALSEVLVSAARSSGLPDRRIFPTLQSGLRAALGGHSA